MSQPPASGSMSQTPATAPPSSSNIERIFETALKSYKKKTKQDLKKHDLFKQFEKCDSPSAILAAFQADQFGPSPIGNTLNKWFVPTVSVLYAFSATLGEGAGLAFSPAKAIFAGIGVLLLAAKDVSASQDVLVDVFRRIHGFFSRLEVYTGVPLIPAMRNKMVEITVEVLDIIATATKEMKESQAKKFVKRLAGRTDLEDGMKKLDKLTLEEVAIASVELLRITHGFDNKMTVIAQGVEQNAQVVVAQVEDVKCDVQFISDQVEMVDKRVQVIADDGKEVMATTTEANLVVQQTAKNVDGMKLEQLREGLRRWQSPPDPSTNHNFASDRQHEGTAEWFIKDDKFGEWKATGPLLWIHGKPGSGKSVLCSAVINDITTLCNKGSASMAYFYFDFRDVNKQTRRNLLSSFLIQLSSRSDPFREILQRLYKTHDNGERQPSDSTLLQCLKEMLTLPNQGLVYLIMDALDECPDTSDVPSLREQVLDLIKDLVELRVLSLHICVTSRPEVDISDVLQSIASQTFSLQDESGQKKDIADYVRSVVYSGSGKFMRRWRHEEKEHVIETLSERANGMFRWVFCQLETLRNCLPQNVRSVLKELPKSLDETYERMLKEIGKTNPRQAYRLLQCLTVATRPLRVEELAEVLALDFDGAKDGIPALNKDWRWDDEQQGVLSTCSSLIVVVNGVDENSRGDRVVQFAHFSVKEFLTSDRLANLEADISLFHIRLEPAHTVIARACLAILLQPDHDDSAESSSPLRDYAAQHWVDHAQFENVSLRVEDGMRRLFDPEKPYFATWVNSNSRIIDKQWWSFLRLRSAQYLCFPDKSSSVGDYDQGDQGFHTPLCLYYASLCGFLDLTKYLIAEYPQLVNARVGINKSPMAAALHNRHWQVAELLYQNGAAVDVTVYENRTPLHAASEEGSIDVALWLLDHGADANSQEYYNTTPLHLAAANGHLELVRALLGRGVDVNATTKDDRTALHKASQGGHVNVARLLIQHGAEVNTHLQTLLALASSSRSVETVRFFIELGADVNVQATRHEAPLHVASSKQGNTETVGLLIRLGADVNARDWTHSVPLHVASSSSNVEVIQLLIERGAEVDARDRGNRTPLYRALFIGNSEAVRLLIEHGAEVNTRDQDHSTPLHLASSAWSAETVRLLIEHEADIDARDQDHSTPLHLAARRGNAKNVGVLLQYGADLHAQDRNHSTPLHLAMSQADVETVQLLIEHGADINAYNESHQTPLHLTFSSDSGRWRSPLDQRIRIPQLLILHGADVNAQDHNNSTPLHLASSVRNAEAKWLRFKHTLGVLQDRNLDQNYSTPSCVASCQEDARTIELLLQHRADVHAQDRNHSTPLHLAVFEGDARTVQLLIEHGADVNAYNGSHQTPLHLTLLSDKFHLMSPSDREVMRLLIEHGADVNARDQGYSTPLHLALSTSSERLLSRATDTAQLLIQYGADVNAQNGRHLTPLHLALSRREPVVDVVRLLLEHGADASVDVENDQGQTPVQIASSMGQNEIARLLSDYIL